MEVLMQDIRYGLRTLSRNPFFTAIAVLCLALGIGANSAVFSVVNGVLLSPLPFEDPDELVRINTFRDQPSGERDTYSLAPLTYVEIISNNESFEHVAMTRPLTFSLTGSGDPERIEGNSMTRNLFTALGIEPYRGRTFSVEEDQPNGPAVVILSHSFWQRRFAGDESVLNSTINLDQTSYTVVGIMPPGFAFPANTMIWVPMAIDNSQLTSGRIRHNIYAVARLKDGVTLEAAESETEVIAARLAEAYPDIYGSLGLYLRPLRDRLLAGGDGPLMMILVAVGFVLLIACTAVASLILARSTSISQAVVVRISLGASRGRLIRQFLVEGFLLALVGTAVGLLLAYLALPSLSVLVPPDIRPFQDISLDLRVLGFTTLLTFATSIAFGLIPAIRFSGVQPQSFLHGSRGSAGRSHGRRLQSALVVLELAVAVVLLIGTGLLIRSFQNMIQIDPGFETKNGLVLRLDLPRSHYADGELQTIFWRQALEQLEAVPGVVDVGSTTTMPVGDRPRNRAARFNVEGQLPENPSDFKVEPYRMVSPSFFEVMGIPLLRGRGFTEQDLMETDSVAIVSKSFAERYWGTEDVLGKRLKRGTYDSDYPWMRIVGVVGDVADDGLQGESRQNWYLPFAQNPGTGLSLVLRTSGDPMVVRKSAVEAIWKIDPNLPVHTVESMEEMVYGSVSQNRFNAYLVGSFSFFGLLLAAVGLYGLMSIQVGQRIPEIAMRMALGAKRGAVLLMMLKRAFVLTVVGLVLGLVIALMAADRMRDLLFGVEPNDPLTILVIIIVLGVSTLLASFVPAFRATRIDPMDGLRHE